MGKPLHVLIVEDSEDDALLVVRELQRGGYKVTSERVETAQAMQAALERKKWDVVIADYTLPHFSAPAALQLLHESGLDLPFLVVSGTVGEDTAVATMKTGAHDYIMKSSLKRLVPAIERELNDAKVRRERKQAEEALRESEEQYRALVENSPNLVAVYQDGHFKYVNKAACNRWGWTYEELTSPSFDALEKLASEGSRQIVRENIAKRLRGENIPPYEINMKTKDGLEFPVLVYGGVVSYGGKPANEYIFVDITKRKQAEEALRETEEKLRQMFESVSDGILVTDLNGVITEVNQRVVEMHGFASREKLLGRNALELIAPRNHKKIANNMRKTLRQGTVKNMEYTLLRADGTEFPGELSTSLLLDASGNWVGRITIVRDITERLEAERKARELQLLKEVDNLRHQLLSNVSHELRTPLTSIKGFISTLLRTDVKWSEEEQRDFLETVDEESDRLIILINDLLDMSRIDAGALKLDKDYYHISEILESITARLAMLTEYHRLDIKIPPELPRVFVDKMRIGQVLTNMVDNAAKYSSEGSEVTIEARLEESEIIVSVADKGQGIPAELLDKIFDRFYQAESIVTGQKRGTGLGLSICRGIVQAHKGSLWVESKLGEGSKFSFSLPLIKGEEQVVQDSGH